MKIYAGNIVIGEKKVLEDPPTQKPATIIRKSLRTEQILIEKPVIETPPEKYHHIKEGELHKMINKKSEYLNDMLALEKK